MLEEIAKKYHMTENSLRLLIKRGIIQRVPTDKDTDIVAALSQIWNDPGWLKISLRRGIKSKARREKFIRELDLTKPERYVLNRYLNAKGRLSLERVAGEVSNYYGVPPTPSAVINIFPICNSENEESFAGGTYRKNSFHYSCSY
jgi:hypothetical protein